MFARSIGPILECTRIGVYQPMWHDLDRSFYIKYFLITNWMSELTFLPLSFFLVCLPPLPCLSLFLPRVASSLSLSSLSPATSPSSGHQTIWDLFHFLRLLELFHPIPTSCIKFQYRKRNQERKPKINDEPVHDPDQFDLRYLLGFEALVLASSTPPVVAQYVAGQREREEEREGEGVREWGRKKETKRAKKTIYL